MNISKTFCVIPWIHFATDVKGFVDLCCEASPYALSYNEKYLERNKELFGDDVNNIVHVDCMPLNLSNHSASECWNSKYIKKSRLLFLDGKMPVHCLKCFEKERYGFSSRRLSHTIRWTRILGERKINEIVGRTRKDGSIPFEIYYTDLRFGDSCNLRCLMCYPREMLERKIEKEEIGGVPNPQVEWRNETDWFKNKRLLDDIVNQASTTIMYSFAGGEPLINKSCNYVVEKVSQLCELNKNISLRYVTNGTVITDKHFEIWSRVPKVHLLVSVDGVDKKNKYMRFPSSWSKFVENLHRLDNSRDNIVVNLNATVNAVSMLYIPDLIKWVMKQNFRKIGSGSSLMFTHILVTPEYLNPKVLTTSLKRRITKKYQELFLWLAEEYKITEDNWNVREMRSQLEYMNSEDWTHKLTEFRHLINIFDKVRGTNFRETFPELRELLDE